jgi:hypothetical protein
MQDPQQRRGWLSLNAATPTIVRLAGDHANWILVVILVALALLLVAVSSTG